MTEKNKNQKTCHLSLSEEEVERLDSLKDKYKFSTRTALIRSLINHDLTIKEYNPKSIYGIAMFRRIQSLCKSPPVVFSSIMCFLNSRFNQFGIEAEEGKIVSTLLNASTVLFYIGYLLPDQHINNPSCLLKYVSLKSIQSTAKRIRISREINSYSEKNEQAKIDECIAIVGQGINRLDYLSSDATEAEKILRSKVINGLSVKEISKVYSIGREDIIDKRDVAKNIKKGLNKFRAEYMRRKPKKNFNKIAQNELGTLKNRDENVYYDVLDYVNIAVKPKSHLILNEEDQKLLETILLNASHSPLLDLWLNEIDAYLGSSNDSWRDKFDKSLEQHMNYQRQFLEGRIEDQMKDYISHDDLRQILQKMSSNEIGIELCTENLLGEHPPRWKEQRK